MAEPAEPTDPTRDREALAATLAAVPLDPALEARLLGQQGCRLDVLGLPGVSREALEGALSWRDELGGLEVEALCAVASHPQAGGWVLDALEQLEVEVAARADDETGEDDRFALARAWEALAPNARLDGAAQRRVLARGRIHTLFLNASLTQDVLEELLGDESLHVELARWAPLGDDQQLLMARSGRFGVVHALAQREELSSAVVVELLAWALAGTADPQDALRRLEVLHELGAHLGPEQVEQVLDALGPRGLELVSAARLTEELEERVLTEGSRGARRRLASSAHLSAATQRRLAGTPSAGGEHVVVLHRDVLDADAARAAWEMVGREGLTGPKRDGVLDALMSCPTCPPDVLDAVIEAGVETAALAMLHPSGVLDARARAADLFRAHPLGFHAQVWASGVDVGTAVALAPRWDGSMGELLAAARSLGPDADHEAECAAEPEY